MYETLLKRYYSPILFYCCTCLNGDTFAAQDCTQEVFLALYRKLDTLQPDNIQGWLYAAADLEVKAWRRKHPETVDLEAVPEPSYTPEFLEQESLLDVLTDREQQLLRAYYSGEDRWSVAKKFGLSLNALYLRVSKLRKKLVKRRASDETEHA